MAAPCLKHVGLQEQEHCVPNTRQYTNNFTHQYRHEWRSHKVSICRSHLSAKQNLVPACTCIMTLTDYTQSVTRALHNSKINSGRSEILNTMWLPRVISPRRFTFYMNKLISTWRAMVELSIDTQDDLVRWSTKISGWISPERNDKVSWTSK